MEAQDEIKPSRLFIGGMGGARLMCKLKEKSSFKVILIHVNLILNLICLECRLKTLFMSKSSIRINLKNSNEANFSTAIISKFNIFRLLD